MRCLLVEDHQLISASLAMMIRTRFPSAEVCLAATVAAAVDALGIGNSGRFDLVLIDLHLGSGGSGLSVLAHLRDAPLLHPVKAIVISGCSDDSVVQKAKDLGATGFVAKNEQPEAFLLAIETVQSGHEFVADTSTVAKGSSWGAERRLTDRQMDVLDLVLEGRSNKQIAEILNLSYGTVKNYMHDLMRFLNVQKRGDIKDVVEPGGYRPRSGAAADCSTSSMNGLSGELGGQI